MKPFSDEYFMGKALDEAKKAFEQGEVPVGCVVVSNNTIIARSHNLTEKLTDVTAHAEMQAITAASNLLGGKYLADCKIYITLEPCVMCAGALAWAQIDEVIYGASDPKRGYINHAPKALHPKTKVKKGILGNESSRLMTLFFNLKRNKM
ncbi:MAG: nucleoside deaminase [Prolixibacteraceae bacterium]|nr:nucleoside deaminase [Prolixibacteraceae bacterium]